MHKHREVDLSHRDAMVRHSIKRLWQRRGMLLSSPEYMAIALGIRAGLYRQVAVDHKGQEVFEVTHRNITVYAVWSKEHDCVRTFLPAAQWVGRDKTAKRTFAQMVAEVRV